MNQTNYYQAGVTVLQDTEDKNGALKQKKVQEVYLIKADSPEKAIEMLKEDFSTCPYEWSVKSLKVTKISGVLGE